MLTEHEFLEQNFWWMTALGVEMKGAVKTATSEWTPPSSGETTFHEATGYTDLSELVSWARSRNYSNVHRSLEVSLSDSRWHRVFGPSFVDIDIVELEANFDKLAMPHGDSLKLAFLTANEALEFIEPRSPIEPRVVFSGHRGFHIEFLTEREFNGILFDEWEEFNQHLRLIRKQVRDAVKTRIGSHAYFDIPHCFLRLNGTWNTWGPDSTQTSWRVLSMQAGEFRQLDVDSLMARIKQF